ncbi:YeeE/YedE family protein [Duganella callida]|uniref:YeeE/YedE family protein n=1 Tax=Duganella callida TaxID=2561932 RepID=A0A4Y9S8A2_9BURK|nr:YeeE/YedE family protein [Duganella callida]TFW16710.1 YeeE/YedE family protein [Duganella callida]
MSIDWTHFTPWTSLAGGMAIGLAAALLILFNGRIAGISGIVGGMLQLKRGDISWRVAFIAGLLIAPSVYGIFFHLPAIQIDATPGMLIIAGLIVGIGTRYGSGCTSGHGVCGISRLSLRSMLATAVFMAAGFVTVFIWRHL